MNLEDKERGVTAKSWLFSQWPWGKDTCILGTGMDLEEESWLDLLKSDVPSKHGGRALWLQQRGWWATRSSRANIEERPWFIKGSAGRAPGEDIRISKGPAKAFWTELVLDIWSAPESSVISKLVLCASHLLRGGRDDVLWNQWSLYFRTSHVHGPP